MSWSKSRHWDNEKTQYSLKLIRWKVNFLHQKYFNNKWRPSESLKIKSEKSVVKNGDALAEVITNFGSNECHFSFPPCHHEWRGPVGAHWLVMMLDPGEPPSDWEVSSNSQHLTCYSRGSLYALYTTVQLFTIHIGVNLSERYWILRNDNNMIRILGSYSQSTDSQRWRCNLFIDTSVLMINITIL